MIDPYVYPSTNILKNKLNIDNYEELQTKERQLALLRTRKLIEKGMKGSFDFQHLKKIHKYIFQDIYDWAGKIRTVDISKGNSIFCKADFIEIYAEDIFKKIKKENFFCDYDKETLSLKLAETFLDINALHPFREGNGRTQREFIRELANYNGYFLSFRNISKEENVLLSGLNIDPNALAKKFYEIMQEKENIIENELVINKKKKKQDKELER